MRSIRGHVAHLGEESTSILSTHPAHIEIIGDSIGFPLPLLELLLPLLLLNSLHQSQALLVLLVDRGTPPE